MLYSASRRTDLVAFYPDFIVDKVMRSRKLEGIVFWTKDPRNLVTNPDLRAIISDYPVIVQLTITGMASTRWEPGVPKPRELAHVLTELGDLLPAGAVIWRFDPIIDTPDLFTRFASVLHLVNTTLGAPHEFVTSFVDAYGKVVRRLADHDLRLPLTSPTRHREIISQLLRMSAMDIHLCCEPDLMAMGGVEPACCIDAKRFDLVYGTSLGDLPKDRGQRQACNCSQSTDIGSYQQACGHGCLYCYA